jgi:Amt family ammonium transporter
LPENKFDQTTFNINTQFAHNVASGGFTFGLIDNNIATFVRALEEITDVVVVANPKVAALNKQEGEIIVGRRDGFPHTPMPPHSLTLTVVGTGMLWVGWFGFNAGSAVAANAQAGMAMLVTQISPAVAALTWMAIEWQRFGKPSVLGFATGAIAGLAAITPGAGTVGPMGAMAIGAVSGLACFFGATTLKRRGGYDDSLDAFGVHGVGGLLGTILVGVFASDRFGGQVAGLDVARQLGVQTTCALVTILWSVGISFVLLRGIDAAIGLRPDEADERHGLDLSLHNESGYNF